MRCILNCLFNSQRSMVDIDNKEIVRGEKNKLDIQSDIKRKEECRHKNQRNDELLALCE